ncbi:RluA family pseudouridine synthase [Pararhodobacter oceanensis]|uniref:Pseudouridine synthase n=1 Tax=Pararhodobacter oceanensis TaxID=2172121 RepID=A0A2T8HSW9_9RHOB|nr:RluA family pseudouridine synthase [Pararhodobacter oceanensis]PVH28483.1 RNA pseudouridine synthase [Pararhodobacter oceanensis]
MSEKAQSEHAADEQAARRFIYNPPPDAAAILHADDDILVVDKPAGLLSVPGRGADRADCLIARLRVEFPDVLLVHRLDLDTSGVIIFGLTKQAQAHLGKQFETRKTQKRYVALVAGHLAEARGRVDLPLIVDWPNRPRQMVCHETGKAAQTDWRVARQEGENTRVILKPLTGRSHQLRVHMLALGHPILGDPLYASGAAAAFPRLMLHAEELRLRHPATGAAMSFKAKVPF